MNNIQKNFRTKSSLRGSPEYDFAPQALPKATPPPQQANPTPPIPAGAAVAAAMTARPSVTPSATAAGERAAAAFNAIPPPPGKELIPAGPVERSAPRAVLRTPIRPGGGTDMVPAGPVQRPLPPPGPAIEPGKVPTKYTPPTALRGALGGFAAVGAAAGGAQAAYDAATDKGAREQFLSSMGLDGTPLKRAAGDAIRAANTTINSAFGGAPQAIGDAVSELRRGQKLSSPMWDGLSAVNPALGLMRQGYNALAPEPPPEPTQPAAKPAITAIPPLSKADPTAAGYGDPSTAVGDVLAARGVNPADIGRPAIPNASIPAAIQAGTTPGNSLNLGGYGGGADIYATTNPSAGNSRLNTFVGVNPNPEATALREDPMLAEMRRLMGTTGRTAGIPVPSMPASNARAINAEFDSLLRGGAGRNVVMGSDWAQRHGLKIAYARSQALGDDAARMLQARGQDVNAAMTANSTAEAARASNLRAASDIYAQQQESARHAESLAAEALRGSGGGSSPGKAPDPLKRITDIITKTRPNLAPEEAQALASRAARDPEVMSTLEQLEPAAQVPYLAEYLKTLDEHQDIAVSGRQPEAVVTNAVVGGLLGGLTRLGGAGKAAAAGDALLSKAPGVGKFVGKFSPLQKMARFGPVLGAATGAAFTPSLNAPDRRDLVQIDPTTGQPMPPMADMSLPNRLTELAPTFGLYSALTANTRFGPTLAKTEGGNWVKNPSQDTVQATVRAKAAERAAFLNSLDPDSRAQYLAAEKAEREKKSKLRSEGGDR